MGMREILKGTVIYESGQKLNGLMMIMRGTAVVSFEGGSYELHSGDVIGLPDLIHKEANFRYVAKENLAVVDYPSKVSELKKFFKEHGEVVRYFQSSLFRQLNELLLHYKEVQTASDMMQDYLTGSYENYIRICENNHISPGELERYEELSNIPQEEKIPDWISGYYSTMEQMLSVWDKNKTDMNFVVGFMSKTCDDMNQMAGLYGRMKDHIQEVCELLMNESGLDLLELYLSLYEKIVKKNGLKDISVILVKKVLTGTLSQLEKQGYAQKDFFAARKADCENRMVQIGELVKRQAEEAAQLDEDIVGKLKNSLDQILQYAECEPDLAAEFRKRVETYKHLVNKNSTEDDARMLRAGITKSFNQIYIQAFQKSVKDTAVPKVVKMLFNFGYMDEELAGMENAVALYRMAEQIPTDPKRGVYSYYEWLMAIYHGQKEPSRNEFDMDYADYLHEQQRLARITKEEEAILLRTPESRVMYELENVFPTVDKTTSGHISTYCPIFSEHNLLKTLDSAVVSADRVEQIMNGIRGVDYSAYYRETIYTNPDEGISKEYIHVEVLPDFILMPNIGTRGIMWQEIEGKRRTTPARMMLSLFHLEDLQMSILRLTGQFRWEMCKREQGARWNDVSERSLTSEYFDYAQFYKKNSELSSDVREKIKSDLVRAKNNFKEMFVKDYCVWVLYESSGSPRLNKVVRSILFTYCTFAKEIRDKLEINPMYKEMIARYYVKQGQKKHRMDNLIQKQRNSGKAVPDEILREQEFLER